MRVVNWFTDLAGQYPVQYKNKDGSHLSYREKSGTTALLSKEETEYRVNCEEEQK